MKLSFALTSFFNARSTDGYSPNTPEMYEWVLNLHYIHLGDVQVEQITVQDFQGFFHRKQN